MRVFYIGYTLSDIADDEHTASTVQRDTSQEYQWFLPPVREQYSTRSAYVYNGCLAWHDVLLISRIIQAWNIVNWGIR